VGLVLFAVLGLAVVMAGSSEGREVVVDKPEPIEGIVPEGCGVLPHVLIEMNDGFSIRDKAADRGGKAPMLNGQPSTGSNGLGIVERRTGDPKKGKKK